MWHESAWRLVYVDTMQTMVKLAGAMMVQWSRHHAENYPADENKGGTEQTTVLPDRPVPDTNSSPDRLGP